MAIATTSGEQVISEIPPSRVAAWMPGYKALSLGDVFALCRRRWLVSVITALVLAVAVRVATARITPLYEAQTQLEIAPNGKIFDFQSDPDPQHIDFALLNTVRDRILATPVLERVVAASDLSSGPGYRQGNAVAVLRARIRVAISRDSWIVEVALRDEDRGRAKRALDALLAGYFARMHERELNRSATALGFLHEQVTEARARFDQARDAEEAFRIGHGIASSDPDNSPHARRLQELERVRIAVESELTERQAVVDQVHAAGAALDAQLAIAPVASQPLVAESRRLLELQQAEVAVLARHYGVKHPRMVQVAEELTVRRERLTESVGQAAEAFAAALQESRLKFEVINDRIRSAEEALGRYRVDVLRMQALSQETATRGKLFEELRRGLAEQEVASRLESREVVVNSPPEVSARAANVFPSLFSAIALLLGAFGGVAAAFIAERFDRRIRGEVGLRARADMPVLATIPLLAGELPALALAGEADQPAEFGEAFRTLRIALRLTAQFRAMATTTNGCCLVVTSTDDGDGRSTVASRLAVSLAAAGSKVLLIDADLRRPSLHDQFALAQGGGLSLLLAGEQQHAAATMFPNLDLIWAGQRPPNPADLLHSPALGWLIGEARKRYDWIVFDAPAASRFADVVVLGEHADGVLMVVRDRVSTHAATTSALRRIQALGHRFIGFVLNGSRDALPPKRMALRAEPVPSSTGDSGL